MHTIYFSYVLTRQWDSRTAARRAASGFNASLAQWRAYAQCVRSWVQTPHAAPLGAVAPRSRSREFHCSPQTNQKSNLTGNKTKNCYFVRSNLSEPFAPDRLLCFVIAFSGLCPLTPQPLPRAKQQLQSWATNWIFALRAPTHVQWGRKFSPSSIASCLSSYQCWLSSMCSTCDVLVAEIYILRSSFKNILFVDWEFVTSW